MEIGTDLILGCSKITEDDDCSHDIKTHLLLGGKDMTNFAVFVQLLSRVLVFMTPLNYSTRQHIKKQRCYFADKGPYSQSHGFSSSHVRM